MWGGSWGRAKTKSDEEILRDKLGGCGHCPLLEIRDLEKEKVYCFYRWNEECIIGLDKE